jgi:hypothetical protein
MELLKQSQEEISIKVAEGIDNIESVVVDSKKEIITVAFKSDQVRIEDLLEVMTRLLHMGYMDRWVKERDNGKGPIMDFVKIGRHPWF